MNKLSVSKETAERFRLASIEYRIATQAVSMEVMESSGFKEGETVRDKDTGSLYKVESGHGSLRDGGMGEAEPYLSLVLRRVYSTGRRPALTNTYRSPYNLEKVSDQ